MSELATREILAASFGTSDGASRGAGAVLGACPGRVVNTAVVSVKPDGTPHFIETKDWGAGRGAALGGVLGLIGGPLGMIAGGTVGALAARLRDKGFRDEQLKQLGESLKQNESVVIFEIATEATPDATRVLESLGARQIVTEPVSASVAALFEEAAADEIVIDSL